MKITGLDQLSRNLDELASATEALDGELGQINFDPGDPASIEKAIARVESIVDTRIQEWAHNVHVAGLAAEMKAMYRQQIIDTAAEHRFKGAADES